MEQFKISHFERDKPGEVFPKFEPLGSDEVSRIRKDLGYQFGLDEWVESLTLMRHLLTASQPVEGFDAKTGEFDLSKVAQSLGITPKRSVFINWDRFETVDRMAFADLSTYFHDIWYPSADDIEVFDDTLSWILFINHSGTVRIFSIPRTKS